MKQLRVEKNLLSYKVSHETTSSEKSKHKVPSRSPKRAPIPQQNTQKQEGVSEKDDDFIYKTRGKAQPLPWYRSSVLGRVTALRVEFTENPHQFTQTSKAVQHMILHYILYLYPIMV